MNKQTHNIAMSKSCVNVVTCCCVMLVLFAFACRSKEKTAAPTLFTLMDSTGINFVNSVKDSKDDNSFLFRNFYNGGGVALGDINNDGLPDVLLTSNQGQNKLYLNKGNFKFEDISAQAGLKQDGMWSTGATMADVNADGWLDIYVCNSGHLNDGNRRNKLYINQHNLSFTESAKAYGLDVSGFCTQASFFDYDMDGDLDCFIINNSPIPFSSLNYGNMRDVDISKWEVDDKLKGGGNHLYRNDKGHFVEVTKAAGLHNGLISFGLGVSVGDINNDGYPDVYVGNDFIEKDYLYINQHNGTFKDELERNVQKISMSSMSSDLGDINNDGYADIFTTDMIPDQDYRLKTTGTFDNVDLYLSKQKAGLYHQFVRNCLQVNNGNGTFSEAANYAGVYGTDWSWGAVFMDADNDGLSDLFVCNGIARDVGDLDFLDFFSNDVYTQMMATGKRTDMDELLKRIPVTPISNRIFKNHGQLQFSDVGRQWGLDQRGFSNSVAYADLDNDGDLDVVMNNENAPAFIYKNNAAQMLRNNYVAVKLTGKGDNTFAVGSKIKLYSKGQVFNREIFTARGFQSSVDYAQTIGIGADKAVDSMVVIWPDRTFTKLEHVDINKLLTIQQPSANGTLYQFDNAVAPTFLPVSNTGFDRHQEDEHVDFFYERNLPEMLSKEGAHVATGDVNGDGLTDLYIGGAKDQPGQLYLQDASGKFMKKEQAIFNLYRDFEDVAVLFFDADKDGDLDLFIGAGGNNAQAGVRQIQHRLYINDGKGNFAINVKAFPLNDANIAVAVACDFDKDGDEDLFVGGRSVPFAYGIAPRSYLYANDGKGNFTDVTEQVCRQLVRPGMITGAVWTDVNSDGQKDLAIAGEWMAPKVFSFAAGKATALENIGLENSMGWWQTIAAADVNGDGKQDLIIGNIGDNFYLRPTAEKPVKMWLADFDHNGTVDQFITQSVNGKDMPVFLKRDVTDQFPFLKKENLKHSIYATKSIQQLFDHTLLENATVRMFNYTASVVCINNGKGQFAVSALPYQCQLSSMNAICASDINGDGKTDLIAGGNLFNFPPQFGRLDASYGWVLMNNGGGKFAMQDNRHSGISITGEVKDIKELATKRGRRLLFSRNNDAPQLYQWRQ